jgi:hypothetical protein
LEAYGFLDLLLFVRPDFFPSHPLHNGSAMGVEDYNLTQDGMGAHRRPFAGIGKVGDFGDKMGQAFVRLFYNLVVYNIKTDRGLHLLAQKQLADIGVNLVAKQETNEFADQNVK